MPLFAMGFGSPAEITIIAVIALVFFGGAKLASFGKSLGQGITGFKEATREEENPPSEVPAAPKPHTNVYPE